MATSLDIIKKAVQYIGTKEYPANSNNVIFNAHFYGRSVQGDAYPWCCTFVWDIFRMCGAKDLFCGGEATAYCPAVESWAKNHSQWQNNTKGQPGDLCLMDFGKGRASHIGIVEKKNADGTYTVIEGNTSVSSNDNGGCVMRRTRRTSVIRGFARPDYAASVSYSRTSFIKDIQKAIGAKADGIAGKETLSKTVTVSRYKNRKHAVVKPVQKYLNTLGFDCGKADGIAGPKFHNAVVAYQKANGCIADGELTAKARTWKKILGLA